ncbi:MAG: PepSY-associated TM helix domain-containing protein [Methylotetracoccus sp.]
MRLGAAAAYVAVAASRRVLVLRRVWLRVHRLLALGVGFVFALMGLTGSLNVFGPELDRWLNPDLRVAAEGRAQRPINELVAAIKSAHPRRYGAWTLIMPGGDGDAVTAWYERPVETDGEFYAPLMVSVDPYTARVIDSRFWGDTVSTWILELHGELFMGEFGRRLVGVIGMLLAVSLLTGLSLWWPGRARVRAALRVRLTGSRLRALFDLHRVSGVCAAPILLAVAFSGFTFAYPGALGGWFSSSSPMSDLHSVLGVRSTAAPTSAPLHAGAALLVARGLFPRSDLTRIVTPEDASGTYQFWFSAESPASDSVVCVDQYSGQILHVERAHQPDSGTRAQGFLYALHTGRVLGAPGRLTWSLVGLVPALLFVSGILRWRQQRQTGPRRVFG